MPTFNHSFDPPHKAPAGAGQVVDLTVRQIADAGLLEVLQAPGAAMGSWSVLSALLDPNTNEFVFGQPLGHAREVTVALSGLFGRFVARAYATKYLGLDYYVHLRKPPMVLSQFVRAVVKSPPTEKGIYRIGSHTAPAKAWR